MTPLRIQTPSRLHLGLLGWGPDHPRQFGGVGLMLDSPRLVIEATPAEDWSAAGPLANRALAFAHSISAILESEGCPAPPLHLNVVEAPPEHVGLGTGTQIGLAVAHLISVASGEPEPTLDRLAALTGRGLRSGIGLHGFRASGLIVDGGRGETTEIPPLLVRLPFPKDWGILLITPGIQPGIHGEDERRAFAQLPPMPAPEVDRLCREVLLGLLPAIAEHDLAAFGTAVESIQTIVGRAFAPAQGGATLRPELIPIARQLRKLGLSGIGQSSWGPTLFAFTDADEARRGELVGEIKEAIHPTPAQILWTRASQPDVPSDVRTPPSKSPAYPGASS